jgi:hypothetical protein
MAIMFVRAQVISRGAGRSVVSAAAYRHRTRMDEEQTGMSFRYEGGKASSCMRAGAAGSDAGMAPHHDRWEDDRRRQRGVVECRRYL